MRAHLLLAAAAVTLTACTTAQGATTPTEHGSASPIRAATPATTPPATTTPDEPPTAPAPAPDPTLTAAAQPSSAAPDPSAVAPGAASPTTVTSFIDPRVIGGPAPVGSFVLGDSISLSPQVGPVLARYGYPVVALVGQSLSSGYLRTHLSSPAAQLAPAWVIELGTNNSGDAATVAQLDDAVDLIDSLRMPGAKQKVLWVTPHRPASYVGGMSGSNLDAFNVELSRLAGEHRWLRILDFDSLARAHPDWFDEDGAMHLHPDDEGQAALVALIAGADPQEADIPATVTIPTPPAPQADPEPTDLVFENDLD